MRETRMDRRAHGLRARECQRRGNLAAQGGKRSARWRRRPRGRAPGALDGDWIRHRAGQRVHDHGPGLGWGQVEDQAAGDEEVDAGPARALGRHRRAVLVLAVAARVGLHDAGVGDREDALFALGAEAGDLDESEAADCEVGSDDQDAGTARHWLNGSRPRGVPQGQARAHEGATLVIPGRGRRGYHRGSPPGERTWTSQA